MKWYRLMKWVTVLVTLPLLGTVMVIAVVGWAAGAPDWTDIMLAAGSSAMWLSLIDTAANGV